MELVVDNTREDEARDWLTGHKEETGKSWPQLGALSDVNGNTLSTFASGKYGGDNGKIADKVLAYRDRLSSQAALAVDTLNVPAWYDTPTAQRMTHLLRYGQSGEMVLIVTTPGIGKTKVAKRFAEADPNVWLVTMAPSTAGVATMLIEIAAAIGLGEVKGSPQQLARQVRARVKDREALIIIDEAQELTDKALNELRGLHDMTGVGIALLGNEKVVGQLDTKRSALAQIASRISIPYVQLKPLAGDMDALLAELGRMGFGGAPSRGRAEGIVARKARAMWISLYQLGAIDDPSEAALEAFGRRQLKVDRLTWMNDREGFRLIEALKAMAARHGWDQRIPARTPQRAAIRLLKDRLVAAQLARLAAPGMPVVGVLAEDRAGWSESALEGAARRLATAVRAIGDA